MADKFKRKRVAFSMGDLFKHGEVFVEHPVEKPTDPTKEDPKIDAKTKPIKRGTKR